MFKKLRFLDYLLVLLILFASVIAFRFFFPDRKWIKIVIFSQEVPVAVSSSLHVGDYEKSSSGEKIAEITQVTMYNLPRSPSRDVFTTVRVLAKVNAKSEEYEFKNRVIKVGMPIDFRFNSAYLLGRVFEIGDAPTAGKKATKIATLKAYARFPWLAEDIKVGNVEEDNNKEKILEILAKDVAPAETTSTTQAGDIILETDPQKVDITLKVKLYGTLYPNNTFMIRKDKRIAKGEVLAFFAGKTTVYDAYIIDVE